MQTIDNFIDGGMVPPRAHRYLDVFEPATGAVYARCPDSDAGDGWDAELDRIVAENVLARLPESHRTVLALRYMDDCSVPECAQLIGRTVHATEALLVRARRAFKKLYPEGDVA